MKEWEAQAPSRCVIFHGHWGTLTLDSNPTAHATPEGSHAHVPVGVDTRVSFQVFWTNQFERLKISQ